MTFTKAQAKALFDSVQSAAKGLGLFQGVDKHEPENAPGTRLYCSIVLGSGPTPKPAQSGLDAVTGQVTLIARVWSWAMQRPLDDVDPEVVAAVAALMNELAGEFTLDGTVRNIDLMSMSAEPAWVEFEGKQFRVVSLTIPIVVNDMFEEVA
jgi:hypothetical protein